MGRGRRSPAGHRGGDTRNRHAARGSDDELSGKVDEEDDPLRDLRPQDEDMQNPANDEYIWPEMTDENEEDD